MSRGRGMEKGCWRSSVELAGEWLGLETWFASCVTNSTEIEKPFS